MDAFRMSILCRRRSVSTSTMSMLSSLFSLLTLFSSTVIIILCVRMAVDEMSSRTKTVVGHNLEATPWHPFPLESHPLKGSTIFRCSYISCRFPSSSNNIHPNNINSSSNKKQNQKKQRRKRRECPSLFRWIHRDLEPWRKSGGITASMLAEAQKHASMRIVIMGGTRLYVDLYYACVQSRAMFTLWGLLQLLRRYPGQIPDVELMFDCMDRPALNRSHYHYSTTTNANAHDDINGDDETPLPPPPLFRYCTTRDHLDIPFPDWSFWGWSEVNIKPWDEEFRSIKRGSQDVTWERKDATAYWKGNPDVQSPIRMELVSCNDTEIWRTKIMRQDWAKESSSGFKNSGLSSQCNHRYKIYAEGYAWSVSLKYILTCGSLTLIIDPEYEDFFTRGLIPKENYWPVPRTSLCESIRSAVDWGNQHPAEAELIGKRGQAFMEELDMERVYDYMYHLIVEYAKLQVFKPVPSSTAQEVCVDSILCFADKKQRQLLQKSFVSPSSFPPCTLSQSH